MPVTLPNIVVLSYTPPPITVVADDFRTIVASVEPDLAIVVAPGLPGQDGAGMGASDLDIAEIAATQFIPKLSLVTAGGQVANSATLAHFNHVVGITMDDVDSGFIATCVVEGEVSDAMWMWTANQKLFLNGTVLSTTPPTTGWSQHVGLTRNSTTVFIRLQIPIQI